MNASVDGDDRPHAGEPGFVGSRRPDIEEQISVIGRSRLPLFFSRYRQEKPNLGVIEPTQLADRLMISVELGSRGPTDLFEDGRHVRRPAIASGSLAIFDLRASWAADVRDPFDNLNTFFPLRAFGEWAQERGATFDGFDYRVPVDVHDEVVLHLAQAMLPALAKPDEASALFLDYVFLAMRDHLARTYGVLSRPPVEEKRRGLSKWQERTSMEFLEAHFADDVSLSDLANACHLSVSSLGRAFRQTMGCPPHRWLMRLRLQRAMGLLRDTNMRIADVAYACGFSDQSHLTRVFSRMLGTSPHRWRSEMRR